MKTYLLPLLAALALTTGTVAAQTTTPPSPTSAAPESHGYGRQQGTPEEMATRQSQRLTQELGLNADQTTKVQQILLTRGQEMQAMRTQAHDAANRDQMREQMQTSRAKYDAQFKALLTADQYTKYTALQAERMQRGGGPNSKNDKMKIKKDKVRIKATDN